MAFLSKKLATIDTNIPIEQKLEDFTYEYPFNDEVKRFLQNWTSKLF